MIESQAGVSRSSLIKQLWTWFWRLVIVVIALISIARWDVVSLSAAARKATYPVSDFDTYAQAAHDTLSGNSPYALDGWLSHPLNYRYHPAFGLLFWPLAAAPGEIGRAIWMWGSLAAWWLALYLWWRLAHRMQDGQPQVIRLDGWYWLAPAAAYPIIATSYLGNISLLLTLLSVIAIWLCLTGRSRLAALICLPILLTKPWWIVLPIAFLAVRGEWRHLARLIGWAVVGYLVCTAWGFFVVGQAMWGRYLGDYIQWLLTANNLYPLYGQSAMLFTDQDSIRQTLARYVGIQPWIFPVTTIIQLTLVALLAWRSWRLIRSGRGKDIRVSLLWPFAVWVVVTLLTPQFEEFVLAGLCFVLFRGSQQLRVREALVLYLIYAYSAVLLWLSEALNRPGLAIIYSLPLLFLLACGVLVGAWWETGAVLSPSRSPSEATPRIEGEKQLQAAD